MDSWANTDILLYSPKAFLLSSRFDRKMNKVNSLRQATKLLSWKSTVRLLFVASLAIILVTAGSVNTLRTAAGHEGEEAVWLPSHQVEGNLTLVPDLSNAQWSQAHHAHTDSLDGAEMTVTSVHNETYVVFLIQRSFNRTLGDAALAIFLDGTVFDSRDAVWGWAGGQNNSTDPDVKSAGDLTEGQLTVVFGRPLVSAVTSEALLKVGVAYDDAIKPTSWNNSTAPTAMSYADVPSMGLELLPSIDLFPKTPFVYAGVLLFATLAFIVLEARRYRA